MEEECAREQVKVGQHGLGHPAVVVDVLVLECECTEYSPVASSTEYSHVAPSSCREGGQVDFNVAVRGLVPGFEYELEITWTLDGDQLAHTWKSVVTAETDFYTLRESLVQQNNDFHFGMLAWDTYKKGRDPFGIEVGVREIFPGLTTEEARIGIRHIDSPVASWRGQKYSPTRTCYICPRTSKALSAVATRPRTISKRLPDRCSLRCAEIHEGRGCSIRLPPSSLAVSAMPIDVHAPEYKAIQDLIHSGHNQTLSVALVTASGAFVAAVHHRLVNCDQHVFSRQAETGGAVCACKHSW